MEKCADEGACGGKGEGEHSEDEQLEPEMASPLPIPTLFSNCAHVVVNNLLQTAVPDSITTVAEAASCFLSHRIMSNSSQSIRSLQGCLVANLQKWISQEESPYGDAPPHHDDWHSANDYRVPNFVISTDAPTIQSVLANLLPHGSVRLRVGKEDYEDELWVLGDDTDNTETGAPARTHVGSQSWPLAAPVRPQCTRLHHAVLCYGLGCTCAVQVFSLPSDGAFRPNSSSAKRVVFVLHSSEQNGCSSGCWCNSGTFDSIKALIPAKTRKKRKHGAEDSNAAGVESLRAERRGSSPSIK